jgi:hypothetical protein
MVLISIYKNGTNKITYKTNQKIKTKQEGGLIIWTEFIV